jgi:hypothetical protein
MQKGSIARTRMLLADNTTCLEPSVYPTGVDYVTANG